MAGLWAFVCQDSRTADAGGVNSYRRFGAQRLVFGARAVDALTVSARYKQTADEQSHKTNPPNHMVSALVVLLFRLL